MRFLIFLLFCSQFVGAQKDYPKDFFGYPLDVPMQLSGNFGELRPNHFHAGFDMKTLQKEGLNVYAVADGYVSRIKMSTFGNGKAIYITHSNGFTSVYGHLQQAQGAIFDYIKKAHYKENAFEIELYLKPTDLVVKKGDVIGLSGNSGASEGPHLHFEFRDTATEFVINPLFFGYDKALVDIKKPIVTSLYCYPISNESVVNKSQRPVIINLKLQKDGFYLADAVLAKDAIGFGINTYDIDNVSFNNNGVYDVQTFWNGQFNYGYQFNTYSFDDMRYINGLIDYSRYKKSQQRIQKLFQKQAFPLRILKNKSTTGVLKIEPNMSSVYRIEVSDYFGNKTIINVPIQYDSAAVELEKEKEVSQYFINVTKDYLFSKEKATIFFPAHTFYEDFDMNFNVTNGVVQIHNDVVPVHSNFTISIEDQGHSQSEMEKMYIAKLDGTKTSFNYTTLKGNVFEAKVKILGSYKLVSDVTAPIIEAKTLIDGKSLSFTNTIQFSIHDTQSGIKSYNGFLNGNWVLFEYDHKTKKIRHDLSDGIAIQGQNDLKIIVLDHVGNSTIFETHFFIN